MRKNLSGREAIHATLRRLEQFSTLSPFCRLYYRLIYDWLGAAGLDAGKLNRGLHLLLRCECRRHQAVAHIVQHGKLDVLEIVRIGRAVHAVLDRLSRAIERMELAGRDEAMIRELLLAESRYHLGHTEQVIEAFRRAIRLGCRHPLVHFALGYNLYCSAMQRYARGDRRKHEIAPEDRAAFEETCREAVGAFQQGLGDVRFDAQMLWWIGTLSELIGDWPGARRSFAKAARVDPENFGGRVAEKLRALMQASVVTRSPDERQRLSGLGPISGEEITEARETLAATDSFPASFLETEEP